MKAEIITIGTEILIGQTIDTNSAWLGRVFSDVGIEVQRITTVPDSSKAIVDSLKNIFHDTKWVIITGGLGPTNDDITKKVLTDYFDDELVYRPEIYTHIENLFKKMGKLPNMLNKDQAYFPKSAICIENSLGTAQAMLWERDKKSYISMPGVPFEMKAITNDYILPRMSSVQDILLEHRYFLIQGIPESDLALRLYDWERNLPKQIALAYLPSPGLVKLRLTCKGFLRDTSELLKELDNHSIILRGILGNDIFTEDIRGMEYLVSDLLRKAGETLSTAESFTGGSLSAKLTSVEGASDVFKGSVIAYSNEIKISDLNVDRDELLINGAVTRLVATQMANGIKKKYSSDWSIATTGYTGASSDSDNPSGTVWLAISGPGIEWSKKYFMGPGRERITSKSCLAVLNQLRIFLKAKTR